MTRYARIDNNAPWSPKIQALTDAEFRAWVASICYADQYKTDGHIPKHALAFVGGAGRVKNGLVTKGCWEPNGDGVYIHDYLLHQRSRRDIEVAVDKARHAANVRHHADEEVAG